MLIRGLVDLTPVSYRSNPQPVRPRGRASWRFLGALCLCAMSACANSPGLYDREGIQRPEWLDGLKESVSRTAVPQRADNSFLGSQGTSPEAARGQPRDHSKAIEGAARPTGSTVSATAGPVAPGGDSAKSVVEALYRGQYASAPDRSLDQFGYSYFEPKGAPPVAEGETPAEVEAPVSGALGAPAAGYRIRPGDELTLSVTGAHSLQLREIVDPAGTVTLPEVGPVVVEGFTLQEAEGFVRAAFDAVWIGIDVKLALGRILKGRVHVVGSVVNPGQHILSVPADILSVLTAAGGPSRTGSLRRIAIQRVTGEVETVDLYELLIDGLRPNISALNDGDIVSVPPIGPTVGIAGKVHRPAIYEVKLPMRIADVMALAGGATPFTYSAALQVERTVSGRGREVIDVPFDATGFDFDVADGDLIMLGAIDGSMRSTVRIEGQVVRPGDYQYREGLRLSDLVKRADGLLIDASQDQALVSRQIGRTGEIELITGRRSQSTSRRIMVLDVARALAGDLTQDILLQPLDHITIQPEEATSITPTVQIIGAVQRPGTYELTADLHVTDLIAIAGNLLPTAFAEEAEIVRNTYDDEARRMTVQRTRISLRAALEGSLRDDPCLVHGDRIVIRQLKSSSVTVDVSGEVRFPGTYVFPADAKITDLIAAAGGLLPGADMGAAKFTRVSVRNLQRSRFRELAEYMREQSEADYTHMVQVGSPQEGVAGRIALEHTRELISRMATYQPDGRVVIPWGTADFPDTAFNLTLEDRDTLMIPRRQETVSVVGHVFNSGAFVAQDRLNLGVLIDQCGGVTEQGDLTRVYVIRADGTVRLVSGGSRRVRKRVPVFAGDIVMVPRHRLKRTFYAQLSDALHMLRSGAETGLLLNNLNQVDLGLNWVGGSGVRPSIGVNDELFD